MSKLVIVESPAKAKNIKKYLGKDYEVMASMGHVRDLPAARLSVDVKNDFAPKYAVIKGKEDLVKQLKKEAKNSEQIFLAADPDREGEAISWHLASVLGMNLDEENRVTFNEITKTGILNGMKEPRKVDMDLVNAQQARRILDRLVGYKLSPFVSQKIRRGLSAGRVQSVAVRLIVDREEDIRKFVPEEYWSIDAKFACANRKVFTSAFYGDETGKVSINTKEDCDKYLERLDDAVYSIQSVKKGTRKKNPAPPFITSSLQQEASRRLGFQAQRTMKVAQELYEGVEVQGMGSMGLITYMRTDSLRISEEAREQAKDYILDTYGEKYIPDAPRYFKSKNKAQDGHEAIRPTVPSLSPEKVKNSLTTDQFKLYSIIWKRFIASMMATCIQNTVKIDIVANNEKFPNQHCLFKTSGFSIKFDGFTVLYEEKSDDEEKANELPDMKVGDNVKLKDLKGNQHFTQPPARFSEATLIKALEENGVGRPSTYATIVTTIVKREYIKRENKVLSPTELGEVTTKLLKERFPKIVNVKYTAQMEDQLDAVDRGDEDYIKMLHEFYGEFEDTLKKAKEEMEGVKIKLEEDMTDIPCEKCGKLMVIKTGRFGKFLACPGYPDCKNTKPLINKTNALCPKCGGGVVERRSKKGRIFFGCEKWPDCDFITWDKPTDEKCPQCGKSLFKGSGSTISCLDENCGYKVKTTRKKKNDDENSEE